MQIAVCEDEMEQQEMIAQLIKRWDDENQKYTSVSFYSSAEMFLEIWKDGNSFDLIIFDIHLKGMNGVKAARKIREQDETVMIIFLTSRIEYVLNGYEVNAWRYLLKPLRPAELFECLKQADKRRKRSDECFLVHSENKLHKIPYESILYFESFGHFVTIHTLKENYEMRIGISQLEVKLPKQFFRCHRSYIVNMDYCSEIYEKKLKLRDISIGYNPKKKEELIRRFLK